MFQSPLGEVVQERNTVPVLHTESNVSIPSRGSGLGKKTNLQLRSKNLKKSFNPLSGKWFRKDLVNSCSIGEEKFQSPLGEVVQESQESSLFLLKGFNPLSGKWFRKDVTCNSQPRRLSLSSFNPLSGKWFRKEKYFKAMVIMVRNGFNPLSGKWFRKEFGYKPLPRERFRRQIDALNLVYQ